MNMIKHCAILLLMMCIFCLQHAIPAEGNPPEGSEDGCGECEEPNDPYDVLYNNAKPCEPLEDGTATGAICLVCDGEGGTRNNDDYEDCKANEFPPGGYICIEDIDYGVWKEKSLGPANVSVPFIVNAEWIERSRTVVISYRNYERAFCERIITKCVDGELQEDCDVSVSREKPANGWSRDFPESYTLQRQYWGPGLFGPPTIRDVPPSPPEVNYNQFSACEDVDIDVPCECD
jgi:hypothetical protein